MNYKILYAKQLKIFNEGLSGNAFVSFYRQKMIVKFNDSFILALKSCDFFAETCQNNSVLF